MALGRLPQTPGSAVSRETAVRYETWLSRFGGSADIIGRTVTFERMQLVVVGVLDRGMIFPGTQPDARFDFVFEQPARAPVSSGVLAPVGRLLPGASVEGVQAKLAATSASVLQRDGSGKDTYIRVRPMQQDLFSLQRDGVVTLFGASSLLLLLAMINVANLILARGLGRQHIVAIQRSLGASTGRLLRQALAESALLVTAGAIAGLALCLTVFRLAMREVPPTLTALVPTEFGWRGIVFGIALAIVMVPLLAVVSMLQVTRRESWSALPRASGGRAQGAVRRTRGGVMLAAEAAIAVVLVSAASLMIASFANAVTLDVGFDPEGLANVSVDWSDRALPPARRFARNAEILNALRQNPQVGEAGSIDYAPFGGAAPFRGVSTRRGVRGGVYETSHDFDDVLGLRMREGRWFSEAEQASSAPVAVVSEAAARLLSAEGAAVGRYYTAPDDIPRLILGVVGDLRDERLEAPRPGMFIPAIGAHRGAMEFIVRPRVASVDLAALVTSLARRHDVRARATSVDVSDVYGRETALLRFQAALFGGFGWVALVVAGVGIYAVQRYLVERRRFEMGVRLALGAEPRRLSRLIMRQALVPVFAGSLAGVALAAVLLRGLESFVFGLDVLNPLVFMAAVATLSGAAALAALGPARRAARVDPVIALRSE
jgi:predicted permease